MLSLNRTKRPTLVLVDARNPEHATLGWLHAILGLNRQLVAMMTTGEGRVCRDIFVVWAEF